MNGCDVLVLGAGSAGCVLAARLSRDASCRVQLVEAGDWPGDPDIADPLRWPFLEGRAFDWAYRTVPQPGTAGRTHAWPRGRAVGGSSCMHAMAHVEGHADDYAAWEAAGGARWGAASLARGLSRCALPRWQPDAEVSSLARAFMAAGQAIGAPSLARHGMARIAGTTPNTLTIADGRRVTAADAYLRPALARPNLEVTSGMSVERILLAHGRAAGVAARRDGRATEILHADTVVVCLGAVGSPLLLLRSGIGDPAALAEAGVACLHPLSGVGRNLHDHLLLAGNVYQARRPVPQSLLQHSESLMYLHSADVARAEGAPDCVLACVLLPVVTECFQRPAAGTAYTLMCGVTHPTSRGSVRITGPAASDPPRIDPAYLSTEYDRHQLRAALRLARAVGHAAPLDPWRAAEILPGPDIRDAAGVDAFVARAAMTHHHPVGTCALGAVLDADLAVRGLENLFVVDASAIPRITTGPIHASVLALAEIWAELWADTWAADIRNKTIKATEHTAWTA